MKKLILFATLGFPGSGKTFFSARFAKDFKIFHLNSDRVRSEIFPKPNYTAEENTAVFRTMDFIAEELLRIGISVIYDANIHKYLKQNYLFETSLVISENLTEKEKLEFYLYSYYSCENGSIVCMDGLLGKSNIVYAIKHSDEIKEKIAKEILDAYIIKPFEALANAFYLRSIPVYNNYRNSNADIKAVRIFNFLKSFFRKYRIAMGDAKIASNNQSFYELFKLSQQNWWHDLEFF